MMRTNHRWNRNRLVWLAALALVAVTGCSSGKPPTYPACGKVVFSDGTPLDKGYVEFQPVQSAGTVGAHGKIQPDGTFQLSTFAAADGAMEGEHRVAVIPPVFDGGVMLSGRLPAAAPLIDPRFRRFETSELKFTVTKNPAENQFVIQVERPKSR